MEKRGPSPARLSSTGQTRGALVAGRPSPPRRSSPKSGRPDEGEKRDGIGMDRDGTRCFTECFPMNVAGPDTFAIRTGADEADFSPRSQGGTKKCLNLCGLVPLW